LQIAPRCRGELARVFDVLSGYDEFVFLESSQSQSRTLAHCTRNFVSVTVGSNPCAAAVLTEFNKDPKRSQRAYGRSCKHFHTFNGIDQAVEVEL
jgi:hypothetical protein